MSRRFVGQREEDEEELDTRNLGRGRGSNNTNNNNDDRNNNHQNEKGLSGLAQAAVGLGALVIGGIGLWKAAQLYNKEEIPNLVENDDQLIEKLKKIKKDASEYPVVGFNCQWTDLGSEGRRKEVSLIQIASHTGEILLFHTKKFSRFPRELTRFLEDKEIFKTGIAVDRDAGLIFADYGIGVYSTYDLRFIAEDNAQRPLGLSALAESVLGIDIGNPILNWDEIDQRRLEYAEKTAKASIDIFKKLYEFSGRPVKASVIRSYCIQNVNKPYVFRSQNW